MFIEIAKLSADGSALTGEIPGEILGLENDSFAHSDGPITYEFFAYEVSNELIVKGELKAPVKLLCSRCGEFFSTFLVVSSFLRAYPISDGQEKVDLTDDIREDIIVEIPNYPACEWKGKGKCPHSGVNLDEVTLNEQPPEDENPWGALDNLDRK